MINILGIEFEDSTTMDEVVKELKRRHMNTENMSIPVFYMRERARLRGVESLKYLTAQELINECI